MLSYGSLLLAALGTFGLLLMVLATNAIYQQSDDAIRSEARVAVLDLERELSGAAPYWPQMLTLPTVDAYRDPGVVIAVVDDQGQTRYHSAPGTGADVPLNASAIRAALAGQTQWYNASVAGEPARVAAVPIRPGSQGVDANGAATGTATGTAKPIGVLLVAKSLSETQATVGLLRTLLVLIGAGALLAALAGTWGIASYVLRPLSDLGETAREIAHATTLGIRPSALSRRAPRPGGPSELAEVVDLFNEMLAALEHATQTQRRFVADASHELRAPLTTMQGNLAFLQRHLEELPPEERHTMVADAHAETLRLARLVDELLLLARADAGVDGGHTNEPGELPTRAEVAPITELDHAVLQLVRQLRGRLRAEGNPVRLTLGHIEPARVRGDEEMLRRIALILLDNAIKYTPAEEASTPGEITISLECVGGEALLRVQDTGPGIALADLPHIFERFYRADRARDRQGTGLGLAIARTLTTQLGGQISAVSAPGQGATFTVALPLA
jgi:signal transduction histidine kinase